MAAAAALVDDPAACIASADAGAPGRLASSVSVRPIDVTSEFMRPHPLKNGAAGPAFCAGSGPEVPGAGGQHYSARRRLTPNRNFSVCTLERQGQNGCRDLI